MCGAIGVDVRELPQAVRCVTRCNQSAWEVFQRYQGATNLLMTELKWRHGPIRVMGTDFVAMGACLPANAAPRFASWIASV